jgi:hypothetical protein
MAAELLQVPLDSAAWGWAPGDVTDSEFRGRPCITFGDSVDLIAPVAGVVLTDGVIELDVAVTDERAFHGVAWRVLDDDNYESFYVRPHQVGNPDSIQYNPVFNGVASWQLYHDEGFWAAIDFPIGEWFTIRVVFAGSRAEVFVGDLVHPALEVAELKMPVASGRIGLQIGGPGLRVSRFAYGGAPGPFVGAVPAPVVTVPGIVPAWFVSDPFAEAETAALRLEPGALAGRSWTRLTAEPSGLVNLAIANGIRGDLNTVFARTTIRAERGGVYPMHLGFSDRAIVYLNGTALFRGEDAYRSRDYRFLGSIGWYDTVYLPLAEGDNDLVTAVSEDFGGWGIQARFDDLDGIQLGEAAV